MANLVEIIIKAKDEATKNLDKVQKSLGEFGLMAKKITDPIKKIGTGIKNVGVFALKSTVGIGLVNAAVAAMATPFMIAGGKMEQWRISFETMIGSGEEAEALLNRIKTFAASTPFELPGLIETSKQLLAFGINSDAITDKLRVLGDIAAGVGTDKMETLVRAYGKIQTKGKATMEELNMLLEAGVPILDELASGYGITTDELFKMISTGKVGFEDVDLALQRMASGNGKFANLMENQTKSLFGIFSNVKDNITQIAIAVGDILIPKIKPFITWLKDATAGLQKFIEKRRDVIAEANQLEAEFDIEDEKLNSKQIKRRMNYLEERRKMNREILSDTYTNLQNLANRNKTTVEEITEDYENGSLDRRQISDQEYLLIQKLLREQFFAREQLNNDIIQGIKLRTLESEAIEKEAYEKKKKEAKKRDEEEKKAAAAKAKALAKIDEERATNFNVWQEFMADSVNSKNREIAAIGKALAIYNIGIKSYEAAMSAYAAMAPIPLVGPGLGIAAAAAALVFGGEQIAKVQSQTPGAAEGGMIRGGGGTLVNVGEPGPRGSHDEAIVPLDDPTTAARLQEATGGGDTSLRIFVGEIELANAVIKGYNKGRSLDLVSRITSE